MHATLSSEPSFSRGSIIATSFLPKRRTIFWLNCPVWCLLLPDSSSICLAKVMCLMPTVASFTGWTSRRGFISSCVFLRIVASMDRLLSTYRSTVFRSARSTADHTFVLPHLEICSFQRQTVTIGPRAFAVTCPAAWSSLLTELHDKSLSLMTFRKKLKTHLSESKSLTLVWLIVCFGMLLTMLLWIFRRACKINRYTTTSF